MKIGIITITYNSHQVMAEFLQSIFAQTYPNWHLYVYDNSSEHSVEALLSEYGCSDAYDYVALAHNYGFAVANNLAIRHAIADGCDAVLLINNDTIFQPDLIQGLVTSSYEQNAKIIAPKMLHYPEENLIWYGGGYFDPKQALKNIHIGMGEVDDGRFDTPGWHDFAPMCCVLIVKDVFEQIGYLDENYFIYYEDVDWMYRAKQHGIVVWYAGNLSLYHKVSSLTGGSKSRFTVYHSTKGKIYFIRKFYQGLSRYYWLVRYFFSLFAGLLIKRYDYREVKVKLKAFVIAKDYKVKYNKKILLYSDSLVFGGHEQMMLHIVSSLLKTFNHSLILVCSKRNKKLIAAASLINDPRFSLSLTSVKSEYGQSVRAFLQPLDVLSLASLLRVKQPDLVLVAQGDIELGSKMLLACKLLKKYVYSYIPGAFLPSELKLPLASLRDFFSRIIYKIPDGFITINNKFMEQLKLLTTNKPVYVLENFIKESVPREIRKLDSKKITIGIVGALTRRKNQRFIIEWLAKTKNKGVRVVLFGDGKNLEMLSNLAQKYHVSDRVEFAGWVQDQGIVYSQIDLLVIPSIVEGVPLVMLEAAIRRVPVLATDLAGISDFLPKEMLFIVNDINDFEDRFNTLIQYPEILWAAVESNYQRVRLNNLQSNFDAQLRQIFNKILTK